MGRIKVVGILYHLVLPSNELCLTKPKFLDEFKNEHFKALQKGSPLDVPRTITNGEFRVLHHLEAWPHDSGEEVIGGASNQRHTQIVSYEESEEFVENLVRCRGTKVVFEGSGMGGAGVVGVEKASQVLVQASKKSNSSKRHP
ncbi:hypothetical protein GOBAR_DD00720 [Gossypium barbadense]|nr:hypothetical protein GOBAR_DD00720 [Gossypium barbadense]